MGIEELEKLCTSWDYVIQFINPTQKELEALPLIKKLIAVARAAQSLMSEDGAREALAHFNSLHILADRLAALDAP